MNKYEKEMLIAIALSIVLVVSTVVGVFKFSNYMNQLGYRANAQRCQELAETYKYPWKYDLSHHCVMEVRSDVWLPIDTQ